MCWPEQDICSAGAYGELTVILSTELRGINHQNRLSIMKGRPITDRRSGDLGLGPRVTHGQARYETSNQDSQTQANARASSDIPAGQFYGPAAKEDAISNGNPSPLPMNERNSRERERDSPLDIPIRERLRPNGEVGGKKTNGTARACTKCGQYLTGQYVRALEGTFHLECFICHVSYGNHFADISEKAKAGFRIVEML